MNRRLLTLALALAPCLVAGAARADLLPEGKTYVPLQLTLDGQDAFKDTTIVLLGCNSKEGRHQVAFATSAPMECRVKLAPVVYAIPTKDKKPLEDLVAKDLGWGAEGVEAQKLLAKATQCGKIEETTLVDSKANVSAVTAKYALEKGEGGKCGLKKVSSAQVNAKAAPSDAPSASAAPSAPAPSAASSASATPAPSATSAPAKSGCSTSPTGSAGFAALGPALLAVLAVARRRSRRA